jgi:hypothetical protein
MSIWEPISSHAEHARKCLKVEYCISAESNKIFKNLVLQARGTIRIRFLQKKSKLKFHASVPLMRAVNMFK